MLTHSAAWYKLLVVRGGSKMPGFYNLHSICPEKMIDYPNKRSEMSYVMQISMTTNQCTFQIFQEHHPECET